MTEADRKTGQFVWHDLMTTGTDRAKEFYHELFGWTFAEQDMGPMGNYTVILHRGQAIGGMVACDPRHGLPTHWLPYVSTDDVEGLCERFARPGRPSGPGQSQHAALGVRRGVQDVADLGAPGLPEATATHRGAALRR